MPESGTVQHGAQRPALIGVALALASLPVHLVLDHPRSVQLAALLVAAIGAIYAGFALQRGTPRQIATELVVATGFFGAAVAGLWANAWIIPAACAAHGLWDMLHHRDHAALSPVPGWYPPFCALYDWVFAAGLAAIWIYRP